MAHKPVRMLTPVDVAARDKIKATQLVDRLQAFVMAKDYDYDGDDDLLTKAQKKEWSDNRIQRMSPAQVSAALGLIKKVIPDLAAVQISGNPEEPLHITEVRRIIVDPKHGEE